MTAVYLKKAEYDYPVLKPIIFEMLEAILGDRNLSQARVLIKPKILGIKFLHDSIKITVTRHFCMEKSVD
jgi:hypothetical protein